MYDFDWNREFLKIFTQFEIYRKFELKSGLSEIFQKFV